MFNLQLAWDRPAKISSQSSEHILQVRIVPTVAPQEPDAKVALPLHLAVALDTSASMQGEKWKNAKAACLSLVAQLRPCDRISLAGFADWVTPLAENLQSHQLASLQAVLDNLIAEGVTRTDLALHWMRSALPPEPGTARVGILITDGHPTTDQGDVLEAVEPLIEQAQAIAADGITLSTVGLGDATDFNSALLISLSDRGQGTFIYADHPAQLTPQLQERLHQEQAIAIPDATIKLELADGVRLKNCCQFRPDYLPLREIAPGEIELRNLRSDTSTDVLLAFEIAALNPSQPLGTYTLANLQLQRLESIISAAPATLQFTPSYREAQQVNPEVDRDRLCWDINRFSTELAQTNDPLQTARLLSQIHTTALKSGHLALADEVTQQLDKIEKTGKLTAHDATGLLIATRQLGDL